MWRSPSNLQTRIVQNQSGQLFKNSQDKYTIMGNWKGACAVLILMFELKEVKIPYSPDDKSQFVCLFVLHSLAWGATFE